MFKLVLVIVLHTGGSITIADEMHEYTDSLQGCHSRALGMLVDVRKALAKRNIYVVASTHHCGRINLSN